MRKILIVTLVLTLFALLGCSSGEKKKEERVFQKDYKLLDAQYGTIPSWMNDPEGWAKSNDAKDANDFRYFVYDTEPKRRRDIACQLAKAKASGSIAQEITQFIKQSFGQSVQGDPTDNDSRLNEYVESTLAQEVQSFIVGAQVHRTYWEKRAYKVELGAEENTVGYTCAALIKMSKASVKRAISRAQKRLEGVAVDPETKENVKNALKDAGDKFNQLPAH